MLANHNNFPVEFLGLSFDAQPIINFLDKYKDARIAVNVISKSGTTLEISTAFNVLEQHLRKKYPTDEEFYSRLIFTTDSEKGYLRPLAIEHNVPSFVIPNGVGGRYSVLSAVGLLPFAVSGLDIDAMLQGAKHAYNDCASENNEAYTYAKVRYLLHNTYRKDVEVVASFQECMHGFTAWFQQLFGESEGKDGKGLFVSPMIFTRDLHSMGQYIQQGKPLLFETFLNFLDPNANLTLAASTLRAAQTPADNINLLNEAAIQGTIKAHADVGIDVVTLDIDRLDAEHFGYMTYFFEIACAMSAYLLGVNPFDQPGVEFYKANMRDLLQ
jgi:glucose-6-phosphate isomerase